MSRAQPPGTYPPRGVANPQPEVLTDDLGWGEFLGELPTHDLPQARINAMRAQMHQEFEVSHARVAERARRRSLGHFGRLAETALVASVCVIHIVWLMQVVLQNH